MYPTLPTEPKGPQEYKKVFHKLTLAPHAMETY